jgi:cytochrome c oxidase subunit II
MWSGTPLFPEQASTMASRVDALYFFLLAISVFFSLLIAGLIVFYAIKYHRKHEDSVGEVFHGGMALEITWTVIPFLITIVIFVWGASVFFAMSRPPDETLNIYVVGKQWMWKFQHLDGQREINELHVPLGRPVKLIRTSSTTCSCRRFASRPTSCPDATPRSGSSRPSRAAITCSVPSTAAPAIPG